MTLTIPPGLVISIPPALRNDHRRTLRCPPSRCSSGLPGPGSCCCRSHSISDSGALGLGDGPAKPGFHAWPPLAQSGSC